MNAIFRPVFAVAAILIAASLAKSETKKIDPAAPPASPIEKPATKPVVKAEPTKPIVTVPSATAAPAIPVANSAEIPLPVPRPADLAKPMSTSIFEKMTGEGADAKKVVDVMAESGVNQEALKMTLQYFDANQTRFTNRRYITLIDYSKPSIEQRMYIFEVKTGKVTRYLVAHGMGSGGLKANNFSNTGSSGTSSLGFYRTAETYYGKHGRSLRLDGLSKTNSNARRRAVVIHAAGYIRLGREKVAYVSREMARLQGRLGRSLGCPALDPRFTQIVIEELRGGSLIYAFK